jgi:hypothetical protein
MGCEASASQCPSEAMSLVREKRGLQFDVRAMA